MTAIDFKLGLIQNMAPHVGPANLEAHTRKAALSLAEKLKSNRNASADGSRRDFKRGGGTRWKRRRLHRGIPTEVPAQDCG
jgi:hypothetical protein